MNGAGAGSSSDGAAAAATARKEAASAASTSGRAPPDSSSDEESPEDGWNPGLNQDEAIRAQEQRIEREVAERNQLISERIGLESLLSEYAAEDHVYRSKIADLQAIYGTMRKTRPDGNCFFRAFAFSLFSHLLSCDRREIERVSQVGRDVLRDLHAMGFSFTVDDFHDVFQEALDDLSSGKVSSCDQLLHHVLNEASRSDYLVVFLRLITSCHLQKQAEFFQAFIEDGLSVKEFCAHEVEPMYKESDHIHVIAVTSAIGVTVRINYLDRGGSADKVNVHDFPEGVQDPQIHLLYRPGHYDVLYPRVVRPPPAAVAAVSAESADSCCNPAAPVVSSTDAVPSPSSNGAGAGGGSGQEEVNGGECSEALDHQGSRDPLRKQESSASSRCFVSSSDAGSQAACDQGVSSSKNPRLDPGPVSSSGAAADQDEPSTTSSSSSSS